MNKKQKPWEAAIGDFNWEACEKCKHSPPEGGCDVPEDIWENGLYWIPYEEKIGCREFEDSSLGDENSKENVNE